MNAPEECKIRYAWFTFWSYEKGVGAMVSFLQESKKGQVRCLNDKDNLLESQSEIIRTNLSEYLLAEGSKQEGNKFIWKMWLEIILNIIQ